MRCETSRSRAASRRRRAAASTTLHGTLLLTDCDPHRQHGRGGGGLYVAGDPTRPGSRPARSLTRITCRATAPTSAAACPSRAEHGRGPRLRPSPQRGRRARRRALRHVEVAAHRGRRTVSPTTARAVTVAASYTATEARCRSTGTLFTGNVAGTEIEGEIPVRRGGGPGGVRHGRLTVDAARFEAQHRDRRGWRRAARHTNGAVEHHRHVDHRDTTRGAGGGIENAGMRVTLTRLTITGNEADARRRRHREPGQRRLHDRRHDDHRQHRRERRRLRQRRRRRAPASSGRSSGTTGRSSVRATTPASAAASTASATPRPRTRTSRSPATSPRCAAAASTSTPTPAVRVSNSTIAGNSSPIASGVGGEIGSPNFPIQPSPGVILRNTIVAGNLLGPNCSFAVGSEGGNLEDGDSCYFRGCRDRSVADPGLDAVADNGGATMTMALRAEQPRRRRRRRALPHDRPARRRPPAERRPATAAPSSSRVRSARPTATPPDTAVPLRPGPGHRDHLALPLHRHRRRHRRRRTCSTSAG